MMSRYADLLEILYEDNHLLALNKPAGWATAHSDGREDTVDGLAKAYLKEKYQKPGNVYLGVVHRLDKPVSGTLLFARTSKSSARMCEQFRDGAIEKTYWAIIPKPAQPWPQWGTWEDWLWHDDAAHRVKIVPPHSPDAKLSRTNYEIKAEHDNWLRIELHPQTGRKHQLRVQLAARGSPILGDHKYGSEERFGDAIALHARSVTFLHPTKHEPISLTAGIPRPWLGRFAYLLKGT